MLLLLVPLAFAQDTEYVAEDVVTTVQGPVFVVPEHRMDELLAKAKSTDELLLQTTKCVDAAVPALEGSVAASQVCQERMDTDAQLILDLQAEAVTYESRISKLKQQRNLALAISGGLVAGSVTAMMVSR